jgi:GMP synthase-like glutamine amidotransferase
MIHIVQPDAGVPPGLIAEELERMSVEWSLVRPGLGDNLPGLDGTDGVIVLGGSMSANDENSFPFLVDLKSFIRGIVARGIPFLGICLGGQLLAAALGAEVVEKRWGERGRSELHLTGQGFSDRLFQGLKERFIAFQWHDDSFDIPKGAILLASSNECPNLAFRMGDSAWGVQFHPEVTSEIIAQWSSDDPCAGEYLSEWQLNEPVYRELLSCLMSNFAAVVNGSI